MGAILQYGLSVALVGIGTVFVGLIILIALIKLMEIVMASATGKKKAAAPAPAAPAPVAGGEKINAPMPGNILEVKVATGASVKKGDVLVILEAMKMENEIMAPCDGTVKQVLVNKGATVNSGDPLVVIG